MSKKLSQTSNASTSSSRTSSSQSKSTIQDGKLHNCLGGGGLPAPKETKTPK